MAKKNLVIILTKSAKSQDFTQGIFKERYHYIHVLYLYDNYRYIVSFLPLHIYFHRSFGSGPQFFISAKTSPRGPGAPARMLPADVCRMHKSFNRNVQSANLACILKMLVL